ncbi:MAG: restriction endonuclease subunit S, partial [Methanophagales archaeon]|nr:restriction endonuclease subunit S [Methanophagales archaeon]
MMTQKNSLNGSQKIPLKRADKMQEKIVDTIQEEKFKQTEIGLIPEEWEVVRLGEIAKTSAGGSAPQDSEYFGGKNPFVRVQ